MTWEEKRLQDRLEEVVPSRQIQLLIWKVLRSRLGSRSVEYSVGTEVGIPLPGMMPGEPGIDFCWVSYLESEPVIRTHTHR